LGYDLEKSSFYNKTAGHTIDLLLVLHDEERIVVKIAEEFDIGPRNIV
jgi:hypothetical protein